MLNMALSGVCGGVVVCIPRETLPSDGDGFGCETCMGMLVAGDERFDTATCHVLAIVETADH
jgi:hypothetical protein